MLMLMRQFCVRLQLQLTLDVTLMTAHAERKHDLDVDRLRLDWWIQCVFLTEQDSSKDEALLGITRFCI